MASTGASFLPRLESVFYAVFHVEQGPKIVSQVPEALIATSGPPPTGSNNPLYSSPVSASRDLDTSSRSSSSILASPTIQRLDTRSLVSPQKRSVSHCRYLFNFEDIAKYVIPAKALCGRLVTCATKGHHILGFPVRLDDPRYERNAFLYNVCFVFDRTADLSCYEPVARKVARVLTTCERESAFLSSPNSAPAIHAILEQLYEDLNSYSETSIPIDPFNSIELKIFPFYPNPPPVKDWMVPLALINIARRIEPNWDLTIVKICPFIDGTNHVSRIARLAQCDPNLTRLAISHLLYYQVIMMIDIFQYCNMYTLRKSIQWLADEEHVKEECGPYVTKSGWPISDWPKLLHLYSRFKPGKTVREWMEEHEVHKDGIDVRRFTTFGVIKGFLRRVHRWPILLPGTNASPVERRGTVSSLGRKRGKSISAPGRPQSPTVRPEPDPMRARARIQEAQPTIASAGAELVATPPPVPVPTRRTSAAETSLEQQLRDRSGRGGADRVSQATTRLFHRRESTASLMTGNPHGPPDAATRYAVSSSPDAIVTEPLDGELSSGGRSAPGHTMVRPRLTREHSSAPMAHGAAPFPQELLQMLDGEHHTDEICTRFEVGWPVLRQWLFTAGGAKDEDGGEEFGNISIIYR